MVVETLCEAELVAAIAYQADITPETAQRELERSAAVNTVIETDGEKYKPNSVHQFLDQITDLIETRSRPELGSELEDRLEQLEELEAEHGAESA
nr:hypothetical protein [Natrinema amylolyticum]